jgi:hypothetical protein
MTFFPDREMVLNEYIYVWKSVDWALKILTAEVTLQEFVLQPIDPLEV